jgi:hypothetical protein
MFNILITEDVVNDQVYYSKCVANNFTTDPAKKFKSVTLEDGTESVRTSIFKSFGTKLGQAELWNSIDETLKADSVIINTEDANLFPTEPNPVIELVQSIANDPELDETIPEPEPIEKPKAAKGKK